jgi:hypothetical protein
MRDRCEMVALLHAYRDLSECVVDAITWTDYGTTIGIRFDYVWKPDGTVRRDDEERLYVTLWFKYVQDFEIHNALQPIQVQNLSTLDWGFNEVSLVTIGESDRSRAYEADPLQYCHATVRREGQTWMEIVFAELEITASPE